MKFKDKILTAKEEEIPREFYNLPDSNSLVNFHLSREPSFFGALEVEGSESHVFSVIDQEKGVIAGAFIRSMKECFVNGLPEKIAYLGSIKVDQNYRGGWVLAKLSKNLHSRAESEPKLYFCSIMKENRVANDIFLAGRSTLPIFRSIGDFNTLIFKPRITKNPVNPTLKISNANSINLNDLVSFLNTEGAKKQLFPVYKREHFENTETGLLKGIDLSKVYIAQSNGRIVGTLGLWDQGSSRKWILYSKKSFSCIKLIVNLYSYARGIPTIPHNNKAVPFKYFSLICIENSNKTIFETLLHFAINLEVISDKKSMLVLGYLENDPMYSGLNITALKLKSNIFVFSWQEHQPYINSLNFDNLYIETGAL